MLSSRGALIVIAALGSIVGASCSQTSADPERRTSPRPAPADARKAPAPKDEKGPKMEAEAILTKHYADKGWGTPVELVPYPHVPYLYRVGFSDKGDYALVHHGKVLDSKGLEAMVSYMKDVKLMSQAKLDVDDLLVLLIVFHAFPAVQGIDPDAYYALDGLPRLKPKLELGVGEGRLTINYIVPRASGGPLPNPNIVPVQRWTLSISKSYVAKWHEETIQVDNTKP
jgi:hypothetical protein